MAEIIEYSFRIYEGPIVVLLQQYMSDVFHNKMLEVRRRVDV